MLTITNAPRWTAYDEAGIKYEVATHYMGEGYEGEVSSKGFDGRTNRKNSSSRTTSSHRTVKGRSYRNTGKPYKTHKPAIKWCEKEALENARGRVHWENVRLLSEWRKANERSE